jgi:hypothetical protein
LQSVVGILYRTQKAVGEAPKFFTADFEVLNLHIRHHQILRSTAMAVVAVFLSGLSYLRDE